MSGSQAAAQSVEFDSLSCYSNDTEPPHSTSNSSDATAAATSTTSPQVTSSPSGAMAAIATSPPSTSFMQNISEQMSSMAARSPSIMATGENHKLSMSNTPSANASPSSFSKIFEFFPKSGTQSLLSTGEPATISTQSPSSPNPATAASYSSQQLLNTSIRRFNQLFKRNTSGSSSHEDEPFNDARSVETSTSSNPNNNNNGSLTSNGGSSSTTASIHATSTTTTTNTTTTTTTVTSQQVVNSSFDNDLANSPNMSSYRYYSNILSNLSDSKMNLNQLNDNASLNSTNSSSYSSSNNNNNNRNNSINESDDLLKRAFRPNQPIASLPSDSKPESINDVNKSSNEAGSAMASGGEAFSTSTSSNSSTTRQQEAKFAHSSVLRMRSEVLPRKTYKTSTEWCGSQLSLGI